MIMKPARGICPLCHKIHGVGLQYCEDRPSTRSDASHAELLAIHEAVMNPMEVKANESDTFTLKLVKEFILRAIQKEKP
jgi:hypothetical protein